ncbi:MAG: ribbon-helix-helix domain-containing protein [Propionibacteriaceae bacterium]|jgi:Arc/MetJ-type ribon-helix-helix transcriptional regulator|nr:ribbon-helix-helix domain-containing protein [Propionibacteriaceae bacterium]
MAMTQIAVRLTSDEIKTLDSEVAVGHATSRSAALRYAIEALQRRRDDERELALFAAATAQGEELYPDLAGLRDRW